MKSFIVLAICFAAALAAPASVEELLKRDQQATVVRSDNDNIGVGGYSFAYETNNGLKAQAVATVEPVTLPDGTVIEALVVRGFYSYVGKDGEIYNVEYVADKDGFRPVGAHLPTA